MSSYSIEEIKKAKAEYEKMIADDPELRHFLIREEFAEMDRAQALSDAREEGLAEGRLEGREEGFDAGRKEKQLETAKKLLKLGVAIEIIIESTGLSKEEIEQLEEDLK